MNMIGLLLGALIGAVFSVFVIWIVGKIGLGIEVDGFGPAYLAALIIGIINAVITAAFPGVVNYSATSGALAGGIVNLVVSGLVLMLAGRFVKGLQVKGFVGALIASLLIALVGALVAILSVSLVG